MNNIPLYLDDDQIDNYSGSFKKGWKKIIKVILYRERHPNIAKLNWLNRRRVKQAIAAFQKCIAAYPRSWSSMWGLGKTYQMMGEHRAALEWFEKIYAFKQDLVDVALEASKEAMRIGNAAKAIHYGRKAVALDHRNAEFIANFALALLLNQQGEKAVEEAAKALRIAPNDKTIQKVFNYIQGIVTGAVNCPATIDPLKINIAESELTTDKLS